MKTILMVAMAHMVSLCLHANALMPLADTSSYHLRVLQLTSQGIIGEFQEGDKVVLKQRKKKGLIEGEIQQIQEEQIRIGTQIIPISDIQSLETWQPKALRRSQKGARYLGFALIVAGGLSLLVPLSFLSFYLAGILGAGLSTASWGFFFQMMGNYKRNHFRIGKKLFLRSQKS